MGRATYADQKETSVGRKGKENSNYILWPRKTTPWEAEKSMCAGHKASLMGRGRQLRGTGKTSLTQNMPQREMPKEKPKHKMKWDNSKDKHS